MNKFEDCKDYEDIINLPHHVSEKRPKLSIEKRAAQFAPFEALKGFEDENLDFTNNELND